MLLYFFFKTCNIFYLVNAPIWYIALKLFVKQNFITEHSFLNIYLFSCTGLSCGTWDLQSLLWQVGYLVVACELLVTAYGI